MKFSALASVYAKEKPEYLNQALESLHKQTLQADEVVIVHDGPLTDGLCSCLEKWKQCLSIKEVKLKKNVGQALGRNAGLKKCTHDVVAIFDTDDINHRNRFEMQIKHLENNLNTSVLITWMKVFEKNINNITQLNTFPTSYKNTKDININNPVPLGHAMFRRKDILSVGGFPDVCNAEDYILALKMIKRGYIVESIPKFLYFYRHSCDRYFLNDKLKVHIKKRWGISSIQSELLLHKIKKNFNEYGCSDRLSSLRRVLASLLPISLGWSLSNATPKEYKSFLTTLICSPLKFLRSLLK